MLLPWAKCELPMTDRIVDLSEEPARLAVRHGLLTIGRDGGSEVSMPLGELGGLVVSHPQVTFTQSVLSGLAEAGGAFVACNASRLPVGMLLPIDAHYVQTERFSLQAKASVPLYKRLWRQIVAAKVKAQGRLLLALHGRDWGLVDLSRKVRSGDPSNIEAQASRRYWPAVFGDASFRRDREAADQNRFLNYGYAILRAVVARAVVGAGLHPSVGIHHHNRYNSFCLADDLMEPLRPRVDAAVAELVKARGKEAALDKEAKAALLARLTARMEVEGESRTIFDVVARMGSSLVGVLEGTRRGLLIPEA